MTDEELHAAARRFSDAWLQLGSDLMTRAFQLGLGIEDVMDVKGLSFRIALEEERQRDNKKTSEGVLDG